MPYFDLPLDELKRYLPERTRPPDFDAFWDSTLRAKAREARAPGGPSCRDRTEDVFRTLSYVDGVNFAAQAHTGPHVRRPDGPESRFRRRPCAPRSTTAPARSGCAWPYSRHEAGSAQHVVEKLRFLAEQGIAPAEVA
jgi:hypothetical protein